MYLLLKGEHVVDASNGDESVSKLGQLIEEEKIGRNQVLLHCQDGFHSTASLARSWSFVACRTLARPKSRQLLNNRRLSSTSHFTTMSWTILVVCPEWMITEWQSRHFSDSKGCLIVLGTISASSVHSRRFRRRKTMTTIQPLVQSKHTSIPIVASQMRREEGLP